jgi:mannitol-1-phosphate/altronate dehydrogenase
MKERIIQFGEGGFLRGFADWMLQYANEKCSDGNSARAF